ncbi:MAG: hypothetical protein IPL07_09365 [Acidimicrobiaceae bacterium]|nr:hypothetical protein [Acidimicrobiaceae bacterium]
MWLPESGVSNRDMASAIEHHLAAYVLGSQPIVVQALAARMDRNVARNEMAKGLIDIACHELEARQIGRPVHDLIGGATVDRIPLCGLIPLASPTTVAAIAAGYQKAGYGTVRIKLGTGPTEDRDVIAAVRERCGDQLRLRVDYNQAYSAAGAARALALIEPFGIDGAEQPLPMSDLVGMVDLARRTNVPLFLHEGFFNLGDLVALVEAGGCGVVGINGERPGGITAALRAIDFASARGLGTIIHNQPLGIGAAMHASGCRSLRPPRPRRGAGRRRDVRPAPHHHPLRDGGRTPGAPLAGRAGASTSTVTLSTTTCGRTHLDRSMTARLFTGGRLLRPDPAPAAIDFRSRSPAATSSRSAPKHSVEPLPADAEVVQLDRAVLAPGFVDTHLHPMVMSVFEQQLVLDSATSIAEVLDAVRDQARTTDAGRGDRVPTRRRPPGRTPSAHRSRAPGRGRARPQRGAAAPRRPPRGRLRAALRAVGFDRPDTIVEGGAVEFDAAGVATGLVRERAVEPLLGLLGDASPWTTSRPAPRRGRSGCCARASPRSRRCARPPPRGLPGGAGTFRRPWAGRHSSTGCRSTSRPSSSPPTWATSTSTATPRCTGPAPVGGWTR